MNYASIAKEYDISEKSAVTLWHMGYTVIVKMLSPLTNKKVLDYGCGTGIFSRYLSSFNASVVGVDTDDEMIRHANKETFSNVDFFQIESANLQFLPERSFDYAVANFVFCEISSKVEILRILDSIYRVLKNDGSLIIMNSNWEKSNGKDFVSFKLEYTDNLESGAPVSVLVKSDPPIYLNDYFWSKADYTNFLDKAGFTVVKVSEPVARDAEYPLMAEKTHPPYLIMIAKKTIGL